MSVAARVSSGTADGYRTDERMRDAVSAMPTWNPLPALAAFAITTALVFLTVRLAVPTPYGQFDRIVRTMFALSTGFAVSTLVPLYNDGGGPRMDCVNSGGSAVLILLAFTVFGASGGLWLDRRWWLLLAVPSALGVARFGVDCTTGLALVLVGSILGLAAAGLRPRRPSSPSAGT